MLSSLLDVWRSAWARKAALGALHPFMARTIKASGGADADRWVEAYHVGFLGSAISHLALRACPALGTEGLGRVQTGVWGELTGLSPDLAAERMLLLSLARDERFIAGCTDGLVFATRLRAEDAGAPELDSECRDAEAVWDSFMGERTSNTTPAVLA